MRKNVFIGCESSGVLRRAFASIDWHAVSCDLLPADDGEEINHWQGDVKELFFPEEWDLAVFFPPCTYLCNSGVRWLHTEPGRWQKMREAADFFSWCLEQVAKVGAGAVENPIQHKHARQLIGVEYSQIVHPYHFGHTTSKATCLWVYGLPLLEPENIVPKNERTFDIHKASPGPDRWKVRSKTFEGIAGAMSRQWGISPPKLLVSSK